MGSGWRGLRLPRLTVQGSGGEVGQLSGRGAVGECVDGWTLGGADVMLGELMCD